MASFGELPSKEGGFHHTISFQERPKHKLSQHEKKPLSAYTCNDPKSLGSTKHKSEKDTIRSRSSSSQFKRAGSASERSNSKPLVSADSRMVGPLMDEVAIRTVIAILSGYIGRYLKDDHFRITIREKCTASFDRRRKDSSDDIFVNMELGMEKVDRLVEDHGTKKEVVVMIKSLRNSIELLTKVASLNSKTSRVASTCGVQNSNLSACAQLYLAIAYKLQKNDRVSSKHLLQVFCDSPCLARTYLLPDLWEHLFLPHLLHLKIWYNKELEFLSNEDHGEKEKKMKVLSKVYNEKMDTGTSLFALYYKQWLKVGASEPPLPIVSLPSRPSYRSSRRRSSDSSISNYSINPNLYKTVFGPKVEPQLTGLGDKNGVLTIRTCLERDEKLYGDECKCSSVKKEDRISLGRSSNQFDKNQAQLWTVSQRLDYFQWFSCRFIPTESLVNGNNRSKNDSFKKETPVLSSDFVGAITTICSSDILSECEFAIRVVTKAWLNSPGDPLIEKALTQPNVVEAILEVLLASTEDEILELIISILAELIVRNGAIRQIILNSDPQLEIFVRLLRSTSLFLKAAVLLYLSKPQAKQMLSSEWVPLVLRVLEFGDKLQTLFTVQCSPQVAAFYALDQLLTGFDEDKNLENARHVLSLGGLTLLIRRIEQGEVHERNNSALIISCCIRAEGSCRSFLAENINKTSLLELIVLGSKQNSKGYALFVLAELLYLDRRSKTLNFLRGLKDGWGGLNIMHIFLIYLQKSAPEERPLVAVILLLLDLMEDPFKGSLYRAEAIEAVVDALNCQICNDRVQEQSARALLLLGGHFSYTGESLMEKSLLQKAGFQDTILEDSFPCKDIVVYDSIKNKEEEEAESWKRRVACVLFISGNKNLLSALANSIANGIPSLARASLITISWMSSYLNFIEDKKLSPMALSILMPQLLQSLNYDKDVEERVLASYSLICLIKNSGYVSVLPSLDKYSLRHLRNLSLVTWTANELISIYSKSNLQLRQ
ncbi:putative E3 ubiquitin-protein ligase LIN-1 isoform X2 [Gastrolobium bilobum]|uniref:putative E3 ubiquitin-protein ligase LIN-1 isoform X2 n=1 Tax=Gastrolobium bilobum TaxID=150636 RepID=UPI002AAF7BAC|nr:putative E3 ubiquitin-protein ligase LIN-1 isoform X2 [Gastrolobium bilobum]